MKNTILFLTGLLLFISPQLILAYADVNPIKEILLITPIFFIITFSLAGGFILWFYVKKQVGLGSLFFSSFVSGVPCTILIIVSGAIFSNKYGLIYFVFALLLIFLLEIFILWSSTKKYISLIETLIIAVIVNVLSVIVSIIVSILPLILMGV